jgi:hypothetical protein
MTTFECFSCDVNSPCILIFEEGGIFMHPDYCPFIPVGSLLQPPSWFIKVEETS